jgi:eukaryotic-like serine/threonine-protein kinase
MKAVEGPAPDDDIRSWFSRIQAKDTPVTIEKALTLLNLGPEGPDQDLLIDLIDIDVIHRKKRGELPSPSDYSDRFSRLSERIDKLFGVRYSIREPPIGEGGLGVVYKAFDHNLEREVALKHVKGEFVGPSKHNARLDREAKILGGLEHPNIVPIHERGRYPDGRPFYVMRLIRGTSLKCEIDTFHETGRSQSYSERLVDFHRLVRRIVAACSAIAYAHSKGVIHYDLKPDNIVVGPGDETQVVDWGLAIDENNPIAMPKAGTVPYMSPEQAGSVSPIDRTTDVYSLGATLYYLLTGQTAFPAFRGKDEHAVREQVMAQVIAGQFPPPRQVRRDVPAALEAVCLKAMALEPGARYAGADALAKDLERWLAGEPVSAWREPFSCRARRWVLRNRTAFTSVLVAALSGLIGLGILAVLQTAYTAELIKANDKTKQALADTEKQKKKTEEALAQSEEARQRAEVVLTFFEHNVLAASRPEGLEGGLGKDATVREAVTAAELNIAGAFKDQPAVEANIRDTLGQTYKYQGEPGLAIRQHQRALRIRELELGPDHVDTLNNRDHLASAYVAAGRTYDAIKLHETNLKLRASKLGPDHPDTLGTQNNLAYAYRTVGRTDDAIKMHEATLTLLESKLGPDHPNTLTSRNNLAKAYTDAGRLDDAVKLHEATLKLRESKLGPVHPDTLGSRNNLAEAYRTVGRTADAIKMHEATLMLFESKLGPDHPDTLSSRNNLANAYQAADRTDDAMKMHEANLMLSESKLGPDHPYTLLNRNNLADVYESVGRWDDAESLLRGTLGRRRKAEKPESALLGDDLALLGRNLVNQEKWSEAEVFLRESVAIRMKAIPDGWKRFNAIGLLGESLMGQGRYAEAEPLVVTGYRGLKAREAKIPAPSKPSSLTKAEERVVRLYEDWASPEKAEDWKRKLGVADLPANVFARP